MQVTFFFFFLPRGDALYTTNSDSFCFIVFQLCEFEQTQSIKKCNELCAWLLLPVSAARPRGRKKKKMPASRCILQSEEINRPPFFVFRTAYLGLFENCRVNAIDFGKKAETACACFDRITDLSRCSFLSYLQKWMEGVPNLLIQCSNLLYYTPRTSLFRFIDHKALLRLLLLIARVSVFCIFSYLSVFFVFFSNNNKWNSHPLFSTVSESAALVTSGMKVSE